MKPRKSPPEGFRSREKLDLSPFGRELEHLFHEGIGEGDACIELVQAEVTRVDSEKGSTSYEIIVYRELDDKYFKGHGVKGSGGYREVEPLFIECFPKEKVITIYV
jgi:hypothetical protein